MSDEWSFDAADTMFKIIAGDNSKIRFPDFESYFKRLEGQKHRPRTRTDRMQNRIFIIGPGFGAKLNPNQTKILEHAEFEIKFIYDIPNPETPDFPVAKYLMQIKEEIDAFSPDVVIGASKGGIYLVGLWQMGYWLGPTVMINAHPAARRLPKDVQVVVCHGSNDEVYPTPRNQLEDLIQTAAPNKGFLYYTANSGQLASGHYGRYGDQHNMASLVSFECLPRLVDCALSPDGPELHMIRTWKERLTEERQDAENKLGYRPDQLLRQARTDPTQRRPSIERESRVLYDVKQGSDEWKWVEACFKAHPKEQPVYLLQPSETWDRKRIVRLERIENRKQLMGSAKPHYDLLKKSVQEQDLEFEPGVHTTWAFHGASPDAIESIITNPVAGFQPLASGTRGAALWGSGVYFARDAKYVENGGFCGKPNPQDGTQLMLMCLLTIGMPCLGSPEQKGVLPFRQKPHRYHSTVDSLAAPEIYIMQHPGAAYPAYLITFK